MRTITRTRSVNSTNVIQNRQRTNGNSWFVISKKVQQPSMRLFCFSHAGGSATVYHNWHKSLPSDIEICAIQLPGRGHRISEPVIDNISQLVESICDNISAHLQVPFAFFGHSMGAMLAFEVSRNLRKRGLPQPCHLMVSACRAPQHELGRVAIHDLPQDEFLASLSTLNGTPAEALDNKELMEMMEPILRADFKVVETRRYSEQTELSMPISVFGGQQDERVSRAYLQDWQQHTSAGFWLQLFPGDHFYYTQDNKDLLRKIADLLYLTPKAAVQ